MKLCAFLERAAVAAAALTIAAIPIARADDDSGQLIKATLVGFEETPAIITPGHGTFRARIANDGSAIEYELTFSDLVAPAVAAHIHVGQFDVAGGIAAFLCGGGGKPSCPAAGGTVTGTIVAADVLGLPAQGLTAGGLDQLLTAIHAGVTYVNVHSTAHPGGEIRGQVQAPHGP